jgi:hypothetical protein
MGKITGYGQLKCQCTTDEFCTIGIAILGRMQELRNWESNFGAPKYKQ